MSASGLPSFRVIASALRTTTERLVREIVEPTTAVPAWTDFEWAVARAVCAMQGISGLLAGRLRWRGAVEFHDFLENQREHVRARDRRISALLSRIDRSFQSSGIACIPLKGSATRALGLYQPGERPQSDIDLLVSGSDLAGCHAALDALDYELVFSVRRHDVYAAKSRAGPHAYAEHVDNPIKIELHRSIAESLPVEQVDITSTIATAFLAPGVNAYPSPESLLQHTALHAAGNLQMNAVRFIQIFEIAQLARRMTAAGWRQLLGESATRTTAWWLFPPLALAASYLPACVPVTVLADLHEVCPDRLRDRYGRVGICDVSWSCPRIHALPGIEWSRTWEDRLRYARRRLLPGKRRLEETAAMRAADPHLLRARWNRAARLERIVRWLFTNPPRVQTMAAVSAAVRSDPTPH